jgi:hypothetical protein
MKMDLKETVYEVAKLIHLAQDMDQRSALPQPLMSIIIVNANSPHPISLSLEPVYQDKLPDKAVV